MSIIAPVVDGMIASSTTTSNESSTGTTALGKNDFLQLLVAQMQYQDPLEPTSNTEYISQYATFSELEEMQNVSSSMDLSRASSLVGYNVVIATTNSSTGVTSYVNGNVDYVKYENGEALLSVGGSLYGLDEVYSVSDTAYLEAYDLASTFVKEIADLPDLEDLTLDDEETVTLLNSVYSAMTSYQQSFLSSDTVSLLSEYVNKIAELNEANETVEE